MRRRIVGVYSRPERADTWIADLYALDALRCMVRTGRQVSDDALSVRLIDQMVEQCLYEFARAAHDAVAGACYQEITHSCDPYLVTPSRLHSWLQYEATEKIRSGFRLVPDKGPDNAGIGRYQIASSNWKRFYTMIGGWPSIIEIFLARFWAEADLYGGERWAIIATEGMDLLNQIKRGGPDKVMRAVDRVIYLRHNCGPLFTGAKIGSMAISQAMLDKIARNISIRDFAPLVSGPVSELIRIVNRELADDLERSLGSDQVV